MIALKYPWMLLVCLPLCLMALARPYRWGIPGGCRYAENVFRRLSERLVPVVLVAAIAIAASAPEWRRPIMGLAPETDFAVVLDCSSSMLAVDDGREDRWTAAKRLLGSFISRRPNDRFSIVLFGAHPVTLSPLTADRSALRGTLERLQLGSVDDGTAIGSALLTGVRRLSRSPADSRVILLLTDGAQNRGRVSPKEAAQEAAEQGIKVYAVSLGKAGGESLFPIDGRFYSLKVESDHGALREIAQLTGGEAFSADDPSGLERIMKTIDSLEKPPLRVYSSHEGLPLARWPLMFSVLLALPLLADLARKRGKAPPRWTIETGR